MSTVVVVKLTILSHDNPVRSADFSMFKYYITFSQIDSDRLYTAQVICVRSVYT